MRGEPHRLSTEHPVDPSIRVEVGKLSADDADRGEMRIIREQMAELAPKPPDD